LQQIIHAQTHVLAGVNRLLLYIPIEGKMIPSQKNKFGIGRKISRLVAYSVFSAMVILAFNLMLIQGLGAVSDKKKSVQSIGYVFAAAMADSIETQNRIEVQRVLRAIARLPDIMNVVALDQNNFTIASMGNAAILDSELANSMSSTWQLFTKDSLPVSVDIIRGGERVGKLVLIADISDIRSHLFLTLLTTLIASVFASGLAVQFSRPLQKRIAGPIIHLTSFIQKTRETRSFNEANIPGAEGETLVLVETFNSMITDIQNRDQALRKLAYYDPLTGLANRVNFQKNLELIMKKNTNALSPNLAVFVFDIDNFHAINDALGHSIGDALLMNVAALLNEETGEAERVARIGGDEFTIIVPGPQTQQEAETQLARFVAALYRPIIILGHELHLTASVGAILLPRDGKDFSEAQRNLDLALHAAKQIGPGRVYFYKPELTETIEIEAELEKGLRTALQNNGLDVHYQPIINLKTGLVEGFEALARWNHPEKGMISPGLFIPVAEKSGLISALGDWVLRTACKTCKEWIDNGEPERSVAVNISAAQMLQSGFLDHVRRALSESGLSANLLCLELTESLFVGKSMKTVQKLLLELKSMGIKTSLDDFGTGYSSLSYLEHLPFDKLKIDRAFIKSLGNGTKNKDLLNGIIALAHALGMSVVAEGAEKMEEIEILKALNADAVQGFIFAKPSPAQAAAKRANEIDYAANQIRIAI
jgi:diguanylate cyclase (GGDEF)-like protein